MTPSRASQIRADRARGRELTNQGKREAIAEAKREEEGRPTIARLWKLYDEGNDTRKVRKTDTGYYTNHLESLFASKTPSELVTLDIDRLRISKMKTLAPASVKHVIALLRRIINYGVSKGHCPQPDPSKLYFTFPKVDNLKTESMTREQMAAYLKALDEEPDQTAAGFLRLALLTGMRKGALMALQWQDIDFERGFITLRGESAKKQKTECIPLPGVARAVLEGIERRGDSPYVFPGHGGKKRVDFKRIALRVREKAGLPKNFRPLHGLRHHYASMLASSGAVDLYTLQKLLTHGSPMMTQRYAHLADESLQRAAAVASDLFQGATASATVLPFGGKKQA
jgi:integrase